MHPLKLRREARWVSSGIKWTMVALMVSTMADRASAQGAIRVVAGVTRDVAGARLPGTTVRATLVGGPTYRAVSDSTGRYRLILPSPPPGGAAYAFRVERIGYATFVWELELRSDGPAELLRDFSLTPRPVEVPGVVARGSRAAQRPPTGPTPGGNEESFQPFVTENHPFNPGDLTSLATFKGGVLRLSDRDGEGQLSIGGRAPSQNSVLLDGASFGATSMPPEAIRTTSVITSTYDPSRGRFSGGQIAATTRSGTNVFGAALRIELMRPELQSSIPGSSAGGSSATEVNGGAGGALKADRLFWYAAGQLSEASTPTSTLASVGEADARALGVSPDSVARFRSVAAGLGFGEAVTSSGNARRTRRGSGLLRLDYHLNDLHTLTLRLDGRESRTVGLGASPLRLFDAEGSSVTNRSGGVLTQVSSYVGAIRNELRVYRSSSLRSTDSDAQLPWGEVHLDSEFEPDRFGSATLTFGGGAPALPTSRSGSTEVSNELTIFPTGETHRWKLGVVASREHVQELHGTNRFGRFTYRSIGDLAAGRPASYTRTLGADSVDASTDYLGLYGAHFWKALPGLWLISGARVERTGYGPAMPLDVDAAARLGRPTERTPRATWSLSPRVGFTFQRRESPLTIHGGAGRFQGTLPLGSIAAAFSESGSPSGVTRLFCTGDAVPTPHWEGYRRDPSSIPSACRNGQPASAGRIRPVSLFGAGFGPPQTWHFSLGAGLTVYQGRFGSINTYFDASYIRGTRETLAHDRNLPAVQFTLDAEGGRPVLVAPDAIDPGTGAATPGEVRPLAGLGPVVEVEGGGRSDAFQTTFGTTVLTRHLDIISAYYTRTVSTDEVTGIPGPAGSGSPVARHDPNGVLRAAADFEHRHMLQVHVLHPVSRWLSVGAIGTFTSGAPFTPLVDGDVNGDGLANDAAFVFGPSNAVDDEINRALDGLVQDASAGIRHCLSRQRGSVARRNSCRGPWTAKLDLQANIGRSLRIGGRPITLFVIASNVLGGLDELLHGSGDLRGWGGSGMVDPFLLQVRGFDPATRGYRYTVNPGFGASSGARDLMRSPFRIQISGRVRLGTDPARQSLARRVQGMRITGRPAVAIREEILEAMPNLPMQVLAARDSLGLPLDDNEQKRLVVAADSLAARLSPALDSLAAALSAAERGQRPDRRALQAEIRELAEGVERIVAGTTAEVRRILGEGRWSRLPEGMRNPLLQLTPQRPIRVGTPETW